MFAAVRGAFDGGRGVPFVGPLAAGREPAPDYASQPLGARELRPRNDEPPDAHGPQTAHIEVLFLVREDAVEGRDYDPNAWRGGLKATSEQDWKPCENNHAGIRSTAYEPGPLSPVTENAVDAFEAWYLSELARRPAG